MTDLLLLCSLFMFSSFSQLYLLFCCISSSFLSLETVLLCDCNTSQHSNNYKKYPEAPKPSKQRKANSQVAVLYCNCNACNMYHCMFFRPLTFLQVTNNVSNYYKKSYVLYPEAPNKVNFVKQQLQEFNSP